MDYWPFETVWAETAPPELVAERSPLRVKIEDECDAWIRIGAPENTRDGVGLPREQQEAISKGARPLIARRLALDIPWVTCRYPTPALAQEAGMSLREFEDFVFGAVLLDWDEEGRKMERIKTRFDAAEEVRIVGQDTDLRFASPVGEGEVDAGHMNMPGGEVFYCPVEDSTEGVVSFSEFPAVQEPDVVEGVRMRYENGRVVEASATSNEEALMRGARHRRGRAGARRVRDRLQPGDPAAHAEHALRREDLRDDPPRDRRRDPVRGRAQRERDALGHGQGPASGRPDRARRRGRPGERRMDVLRLCA